ncbi:MAG: glycosyl hydrolase [Verrucomicrobiota bacterium]|jgi:hypothetical protein
MKLLLTTALLCCLICPFTFAADAIEHAPSAPLAVDSSASDILNWPTPTQSMRPWSRWWWLGSAVDAPNIQRLLTLYHDAGLGGVEICPIYGAKGYESSFISYISPKWMDAYSNAITDARQLGMGLDLTTGTGWPMGGPWIDTEHASSGIVLKHFTVNSGQTLNTASDGKGLPKGRLQALRAINALGQSLDLISQFKDNNLIWTAPEGTWTVYVLIERGPIQKVKRSAPGGEGNVLDPYSVKAMDLFLAKFDAAFKASHAEAPRAEFHDSFEYYGATWTPDFLSEFSARRGYDLLTELPAFFGTADTARAARVRFDYRQTLADLHHEYVKRWTDWSHEHGSLTREQAHGAPANIEDIYATTDIPETEASFGGVAGVDYQIPMMKFSSSAAHLNGRLIASSETFTWLGEHFQVPLSQLKPTVDFFFLTGVNHIFFHGIPYSPKDAPWPGWLFYASVNLGPEGGLWNNLPAFNAYATRCQSILQAGKPANDILLYFPIADFWQQGGKTEGLTHSGAPSEENQGNLIRQFGTPGKWMLNTPFLNTAMQLWKRGYSYDEVTDNFISKAHVEGQSLSLGSNTYDTILVPPTQYIASKTLTQLVSLASQGATILFEGNIPKDVPGLEHLKERQSELAAALKQIDLKPTQSPSLFKADIGSGTIYVGTDLNELLSQSSAKRESMNDLSLESVRRKRTDGYDYFIVNRGTTQIDRWVPLAHNASSAVLLDPLQSNLSGAAALKHTDKSSTEIYLQLAPGDSCIVRTLTEQNTESANLKLWKYASSKVSQTLPITGTWHVDFSQGGPKIPKSFDTTKLGSWADKDTDTRCFSGSSTYSIHFSFNSTTSNDWSLDLGKVCDSARVTLNGHLVTTLWCVPFKASVTPWLKQGDNLLQIEVTNLAANRIADLDRRHVKWKSFYEINFVNHGYLPFDASDWPLRDSGLVGPVSLNEITPYTPAQ